MDAMTNQSVSVASEFQDRVTVTDGRVSRVEEYTTWNRVAGGGYFTLDRRGEQDFLCNSGDDEHGGGQVRGTLEQAVAGLHETFQQQYIALFNLSNLTAENAAAEVARVMGETPRKYAIVFV
jgi:hypothetical protein